MFNGQKYLKIANRKRALFFGGNPWPENMRANNTHNEKYKEKIRANILQTNIEFSTWIRFWKNSALTLIQLSLCRSAHRQKRRQTKYYFNKKRKTLVSVFVAPVNGEFVCFYYKTIFVDFSVAVFSVFVFLFVCTKKNSYQPCLA